MSFPEGSNLRANSQQKKTSSFHQVQSYLPNDFLAKLLYINEFPKTRGVIVSDGLGLNKTSKKRAASSVKRAGWGKNPILRPGRCQKLLG